ncbi:hypothetical protein HYH03_012813 [Edaphochlamys debaryana]|uniref:MYND-type domain-containing protein n=1 Tax=Edaphochlamys debaryana TaxID=47281 RepID=A0A835XXG1_9CHLO|nr:hypothetical protein HYH03_012813 [Edaphochlamys debaryana]|eukprot:KAG2488645.1 hypothetical protein HYH03_012813 [Edaphochlamys debaryana]
MAATSAAACAWLTKLCAMYACMATVVLKDLVEEAASPGASASSAAPPAPELDASPIHQLLAALAESRLLPTVAWAILRGCPAPEAELVLLDRPDGLALKTSAELMDAAAYSAANALQVAHALRILFTADVGQQLASQLSHPDVVALQEALLERLCVHGGVEGEGEGEGEERGQAPEEERGQRARQGRRARAAAAAEAGGAGPSGRAVPAGGTGRWWLPALEARLGHVISGLVVAGGPGERLQYAAIPVLRCLSRSLHHTAGGYSPSPRLARLEPRALEALCRLFRGEGLAGACSRRPAWDPAFAQDVDGLVLQTRSAETAAWALALNLEGLEGRLEGRGSHVARPLTEAVCGAALVLEVLRRLGDGESTPSAPALLGAPSREALAAALTRAGLAASLDHALRLAFAAADRAALAPGDASLQHLAREAVQIPIVVPRLLGNWALPPQVRHEAGGGVLVTLGKRARMMTRRLQELEAEAEGSGEGAARVGALKRERQLLALVSTGLLNAMPGPSLLPLIRDQLGPPGAGSRPAPDVEAEAFAGRWQCLLATQAAARAAPLRLHRAQHQWLVYAMRESLRHVWLGCTSSEASLSAAQLLALQPHRLLAAACKLVCARVEEATSGGADEGAPTLVACQESTAAQAVLALTELAAHPQLSDRVRLWLVPPGGGGGSPGGGSGRGGGGGRAGNDFAALGGSAGSNCTGLEAGPGALGSAVSPGERGCLEAAVRVGLQPWLRDESLRGTLDALLRTAAPAGGGGDEAAGGSEGDESAGAGGDGSSGGEVAGDDTCTLFRSSAASLATVFREGGKIVLLNGDTGAVYNSTAGTMTLLELGPPLEDGERPPPDVAALLAAPLPPPIAVPLAEAAFPGLRVCEYPGCLSYGGRSEAELPLKHCARCKCVRYCSQECQREHWREGHKAKCRSC